MNGSVSFARTGEGGKQGEKVASCGTGVSPALTHRCCGPHHTHTGSS